MKNESQELKFETKRLGMKYMVQKFNVASNSAAN